MVQLDIPLYVKVSAGKSVGQMLFCSFVIVFNHSHWELPCGLYGGVIDCSTVYILHSVSMILLSKVLP